MPRRFELGNAKDSWWAQLAQPHDDTGWVAVTPTNNWAVANSRTVQARKVGNVIYIRGQLTAAAATADGCGVLPSGFYGVQQLGFAIGTEIGAGFGADVLLIDTSGNLSIKGWAATHKPYLCVSYVLDAPLEAPTMLAIE